MTKPFQIKFILTRAMIAKGDRPRVIIVRESDNSRFAEIYEPPLEKPQAMGDKTIKFWQPGPLTTAILDLLNTETDAVITAADVSQLRSSLNRITVLNRVVVQHLIQVGSLLNAALHLPLARADRQDEIALIGIELQTVMERLQDMLEAADVATE